MTPSQAREIMAKFKGTVLYPDDNRPFDAIKPVPLHESVSDFTRAEGFLEGWNAAVKKSAEVTINHETKGYDEAGNETLTMLPSFQREIEAKILKLSASSEGEEGK